MSCMCGMHGGANHIRPWTLDLGPWTSSSSPHHLGPWTSDTTRFITFQSSSSQIPSSELSIGSLLRRMCSLLTMSRLQLICLGSFWMELSRRICLVFEDNGHGGYLKSIIHTSSRGAHREHLLRGSRGLGRGLYMDRRPSDRGPHGPRTFPSDLPHKCTEALTWDLPPLNRARRSCPWSS